MEPEERTLDYLKDTVRKIVFAVRSTERTLHSMYPALNQLPTLEPDITFITTQELEDLYPELTPKERENEFLRVHHTVFLMQIGGKLKSGAPHDGRAPDYDDWALNGDLLFWNRILERAFEVSSMGIRVSPESLDRQLTLAGCEERRELPFHKALLKGELPYTIGGRHRPEPSGVCCCWGSAHIGEVQASVWDAATREACEKAGIPLL